MFTKWFESLVADIVNGLLSFGLGLIKSVMVTPLHMQYIPGFSALQKYLIVGAFAWLVVAVGKEFLANQLEGFNGTDVNPLAILKNGVVAGILIGFSPFLVAEIILPLTTFILGLVQSTLGNVDSLSKDMITHLKLTTGDTGGVAVLAAAFPEAGFFGGAVYAGSFMVVAVIVGIQSGFRWFELIFLALAGPPLALSKASYSTAWDLWLKETISVAFSQIIQFFSVCLGMNVFLNPISMDKVNGGQHVPLWAFLFLALGGFIFALRGPKTLRTILGAPSNGAKAIQSMAGMIAGRM